MKTFPHRAPKQPELHITRRGKAILWVSGLILGASTIVGVNQLHDNSTRHESLVNELSKPLDEVRHEEADGLIRSDQVVSISLNGGQTTYDAVNSIPGMSLGDSANPLSSSTEVMAIVAAQDAVDGEVPTGAVAILPRGDVPQAAIDAGTATTPGSNS
jgi:hypothetical protein